MSGSRGVGGARRSVVVLLAAVLPLGVSGLALARSAAAATRQNVGTKPQWQLAMAKVQEPATGCYHASYPALRWQAVKCMVAPKWPVAPAPSGTATRGAPATVGGGIDYAAQTSGLISQATGSFQDVSPRITEQGQVDAMGAEVANAFTLQLNSQFFNSPACAQSSNPSDCQGWQQFVYSYDADTGLVYMQYWLIDFDATCPSGWFSFGIDCYTNSSAGTLSSPLTAGDLASVKMSGSADSGGNDGISLSVGSGQATLVTGSDSVLDLAGSWNTAEWGVFGDGGGGEAFFGSGTTLAAKTALTTASSSAPACLEEGFTAETNNLSLTSTPALGNEPSPTVVSKQTNGTSGTASCAVAARADTSATSLKLSASTVTFGHEKAEHLTVQVTSQPSGAVTGMVTITAKAATGKPVKVCVTTLKNGAGSCTPSAKALQPGTWRLTAAYGGAVGILTSQSPAKTLKVRE